MINLFNYIKASRIKRLQTVRKEEIITELTRTCIEGLEIHQGTLIQDLLQKSQNHVNLGHGFAICHTRTSESEDIAVAIGILPEKVNFVKGDPSGIIFVIIVPEGKSRAYLSFLAHLTRLLSMSGAYETLHEGNWQKIEAFIQHFLGQ